MKTLFLTGLLIALLSLSAAPRAQGQDEARIFLPLLAGGPVPPSLVADLTPGPEGSQLYELTARGDTLFFVRGCGELWATEGDSASLRRLHSWGDIFSGCPIAPSLTVVGETLFFTLWSEEQGPALWASDGTASGTRRVIQFPPTSPGGQQHWLYPLVGLRGELVFFLVSSELFAPVGAEMWRSDGTAAGTRAITTLEGRGVSRAVAFGDQIYLTVEQQGAEELWVSDGTAAGTQPILTGRRVIDLTATANGLWFSSWNWLEQGFELWASDGTSAGTRPLRTFGDDELPRRFVELNGSIYFSLLDPGSADGALWASDGTAEGTRPVFVGGVRGLTAHNSALYFGNESGLFRSDGTSAGTSQIKALDVPFGTLYSAGRWLFFEGGPTGDAELWASDGTSAGTFLVDDIIPGSQGSSPSRLIRAGDTLFFLAYDQSHGQELWALPLAGW